ncbi:11651_t:CDS:2 [Diversispora eburnea]|uniref:11651_t:CDS:1 n=1 Tax=Diversispora eburnea TaxID=1213867 RepID=A0A9N8ZUW7_9GLOM|nr:11651_t:CDS:2 [Diversispora eburnea]
MSSVTTFNSSSSFSSPKEIRYDFALGELNKILFCIDKKKKIPKKETKDRFEYYKQLILKNKSLSSEEKIYLINLLKETVDYLKITSNTTSHTVTTTNDAINSTVTTTNGTINNTINNIDTTSTNTKNNDKTTTSGGDGPYFQWDSEHKKLIRLGSENVILKNLKNNNNNDSKNSNEDWLLK